MPSQYTTTSCGTQCYFQALYYCTDSSPITKFSYSSTASPTITYKFGTNSAIINITSFTNVGNYNYDLTFGSAIFPQFTITSYCYATPTSITITPLEPLSYSFLDSSYSTSVAISGLNKIYGNIKEFDITCDGFIKCSLRYSNLNYILKFYGAPTTYSPTWTFQICMGSSKQQLNFTINSPLTSLNYTYSNLNFFTPLNTMSRYSYPQYSFDLQSNTNDHPYLALTNNNPTNIPFSNPYPIKSVNGITTYMGSFEYPPNLANTSFILNTQTLTSITPLFNQKISSNIPYKSSSNYVPISSTVLTTKSSNFNLNMFTISFQESNNYGPSQYSFGLNYGYNNIMNSPFGIVSGNYKNANYSLSFITYSSTSSNFQQQINYNGYKVNINNSKGTSLAPTITDINTLKSFYNDDSILIRVTFNCPNGLLFASIQRIKNENQVTQETFYYYQDFNIISGTNKNGILELIYNYKYIDNSTNEAPIQDMSKLNVVLYDISLNSTKLTKGEYITINPNKIFSFPTNYQFNSVFAKSTIQNITFLNNNVDLTNNSGHNIMYLKLTTGQLTNSTIKFSYKAQIDTTEVYGIWNSSISSYQFLFYLPSNIIPGKLPYSLNLPTSNYIFNTQLSSSFQLNIISNNSDLYGPIFKTITKVPYTVGSKEIGWKVTIEDLINGYRDGYVVVSGSVDNKSYNISIKPSIQLFKFDYYIKVTLPEIIISQDYFISQVVLYDNQGINSTFISYSYNDYYQYSNPFINYINDNTINTISVSGNAPPNNNVPNLVELTISTNELIFGIDNIVNVRLTVDQPSILSSNPIVYFTTTNLETLECLTQNENTNNSTHSFFNCYITIESGFGYPLGLSLSVHNMHTLYGNINGYSSSTLDSMKFPYLLPYGLNSQTVPILISSSSITSEGGLIVLFGKNLDKCTSILIEYNGNNITQTFNIPSYNSMISTTLNGNFQSSFKISCLYSTRQSKPLILYPTIVKYYTDPYISQSSSSESEELPTTPPLECNNNCGGPNNGYCSSKGCICFSPFIGDDCLSEVIISPPELNNTSPVVTFPNMSDPTPTPSPSSTPTTSPITSSGHSTPTPTHSLTPTPSPISVTKSIINIIELREIDIYGKVVQSYPFDYWVSSKPTPNIYLYSTQIDNDGYLTNITTQLEMFDKDTNITFANQPIRILKSSIKYTIQLTFYNFKSPLNYLQLVMSASINSTQTKNICSKKDYGQSIDNSDYIKLSIQNISLYGKFIKRAIVDGSPRSCSNILLDQSMNLINSSNSQQSYIAIQVPYFKNSLIIDPDFSVLLDGDGKNNKNNKNSICTYDPDNSDVYYSDEPNDTVGDTGLSTTKIAGIIIGSVAFASAAAFATFYTLYKKRLVAKEMSGLNIKLDKVKNNI